jgi:hypothetical protein
MPVLRRTACPAGCRTGLVRSGRRLVVGQNPYHFLPELGKNSEEGNGGGCYR